MSIRTHEGGDTETNALAFCIESEISREERYRERQRTAEAMRYQQSVRLLEEQNAVLISNILNEHSWSCIEYPKGSTVNQGLRVVVRYIEARPQRMHESFAFLAIEALHNAWPCRKGQ